ncbi:MAG: GerAB/ArcD/ProY family transporter [Bacillota bacterium]|nr:GerAB/ArcD/ProY family transporter [Bacillota bacterium]
MNSISKHQLFSLMIIFEIGSTTLFALGIEGKQDAWIVILLAMVIGLCFVWVYCELQKAFPRKNFIEIINSILGKWLGIPLSLLYAVFWLWPTARNLREFGELITLTILPNTPLVVILCTFVFTSFFVLSLGVRVLGRTSEIIMPLIVFLILVIFVMVALSGHMEPRNLLPVSGVSIKEIAFAAYPNVAMFPFGEIFIFSMYWCYVTDYLVVHRTSALVIILSGFLLSLTLAVFITVLGVKFTAASTIPFIEVVKMVSIGEFLTNLDAIGICVIFLGGFYKMSIYLLGVTMVLATVFNIKSNRLLLFIVCILLLWVSVIFEPNYTFHQWMNPFDTNYFYTPFLHVIPLLLFLIHRIKSKSQKLTC